MEKSKVVSVRVPEDVLKELEEAAKGSDYYSKSDFINAGIKLALVARKRGKFRDLIHFYPKYGDVVDEFSFKYHREVKR